MSEFAAGPKVSKTYFCIWNGSHFPPNAALTSVSCTAASRRTELYSVPRSRNTWRATVRVRQRAEVLRLLLPSAAGGYQATDTAPEAHPTPTTQHYRQPGVQPPANLAKGGMGPSPLGGGLRLPRSPEHDLAVGRGRHPSQGQPTTAARQARLAGRKCRIEPTLRHVACGHPRQLKQPPSTKRSVG